MSRLAMRFNAADRAAALTAFTKTAVLTGVDTGTDMTASQAATIVADLAAIQTELAEIKTALENAGIVKTS